METMIVVALGAFTFVGFNYIASLIKDDIVRYITVGVGSVMILAGFLLSSGI